MMRLSLHDILELFRRRPHPGGTDRPTDSPPAPPPPVRRTTLNYPATTLGALLDQTADRFADAPAMVYNDHRWSWSQVRAQVDRLAGGLAVMGVRRGDRVLITLPNCPEFVFAFFAVQTLGAVVVNAGPLKGVDELRELLAKAQPRLVIALDLQAPQLERAAAGDQAEVCWLWVSLRNYQQVFQRLGYRFKLWQGRQSLARASCQATLEELMERAPSRPPMLPPSPGDVAVLQPTGGTTGSLKVAELTHRNLLANALQLALWARIRPGQERILAVLPMFHVYGLTAALISAVLGGGMLIPLTRFRMDEFLDAVGRHCPTMVSLVPAIFEALCDRIEADPEGTGAAVNVLAGALVTSGAAPLGPATSKRFAALTGAAIVQGYGLTEASPVTHTNPPDGPREGSIGRPLPDTQARVVDLDDPSRDLPAGQPGELLVAGPQIMRGYFADPDATAAAITTDEQGRRWLHTGDVVRVDEDGFFHVLDRRKDMINAAGLKVWPGHVERILAMHPQVADVAVVGWPDPVETECVVAMIVPRSEPPDEAKLASELRALCREHLGPHEVPRRFEFVQRLPRSALGKLLKYELRDMSHEAVKEEKMNAEGQRPQSGTEEGDE
ncbi:MAG: Long-chain-fatty-acid--CoA ligase [Phycisphaerae bacterium]|nr:Long-chain-fatty-acid--CoA ligase [Phycisphaerae bacterium]